MGAPRSIPQREMFVRNDAAEAAGEVMADFLDPRRDKLADVIEGIEAIENARVTRDEAEAVEQLIRVVVGFADGDRDILVADIIDRLEWMTPNDPDRYPWVYHRCMAGLAHQLLIEKNSDQEDGLRAGIL